MNTEAETRGGEPPFRSRGIGTVLRAIATGFHGESLGLRAGNLTFVTLMSLVPVVAVVLSLVHVYRAERVDALLIKFFEGILLPGGRGEADAAIQKLLISAKSRVAGGASFGALLLSSALMLRNLDASLNAIWSVRQKRSMWVSMALYAAITIFGPLLIAVSLLGIEEIVLALRWLDLPFPQAIGVLRSLVLAVALLTTLYKFAPHAPVLWRSALLGGIVAGVVWESARHLYSTIATVFLSSNPLYGSLGMAPLFLMWIYVGWYIVLGGARLAYAVEHVDLHHEYPHVADRPRLREVIAAAIARSVLQAELQADDSVTTKSLAAHFRIPEQKIIEVAALMERFGLIHKSRRSELEATPRLQGATLAEISMCVGGIAAPNDLTQVGDNRLLAQIEALFDRVDGVTIEKLKSISIKEVPGTNGMQEKA